MKDIKERIQELEDSINELEAEERRLIVETESLEHEVAELVKVIGTMKQVSVDMERIENYLRDNYVYPEIGSEIWVILEGYRDV